jgi:hypothetical protein
VTLASVLLFPEVKMCFALDDQMAYLVCKLGQSQDRYFFPCPGNPAKVSGSTEEYRGETVIFALVDTQNLFNMQIRLFHIQIR